MIPWVPFVGFLLSSESLVEPQELQALFTLFSFPLPCPLSLCLTSKLLLSPVYSSIILCYSRWISKAMAVSSRGRGELSKQWKKRETNPESTKIWAELKPRTFGRKVSVVYYLARGGHLEQPHFMEVPLSSIEGLYLRGIGSENEEKTPFRFVHSDGHLTSTCSFQL